MNDKRTQYQRVLALLNAGEIVTSLDAARLPKPIFEVVA